MPKLSTYSNFDYPEGEEQIMPWEFWTEEERSLVIRDSYKDLTLTSKQVKTYLDASRLHFYTQWLVPIAVAAAAFGPLKGSLFAKAYQKHRTLGLKQSAILTGGFTLAWLNLSPFYINKEDEQVRLLKILWKKVGSSMKTYNDMVSSWTTSTSLDKDTYKIWASRNASTNTNGFEEDSAPYLLPNTIATKKIKRIYL